MSNSTVQTAEAPPGVEGAGFFATSLDSLVGLARANSLWPLPFATSCCGIEFMSTMASHYDIGRFGAERLSFSARQADVLMVMGTISKKMAPVVKQVYLQMAEPRWVLSVGACACSGVFLIRILFCKELIVLSQWTYMYQVAHHVRSKFWMALCRSKNWQKMKLRVEEMNQNTRLY